MILTQNCLAALSERGMKTHTGNINLDEVSNSGYNTNIII